MADPRANADRAWPVSKLTWAAPFALVLIVTYLFTVTMIGAWPRGPFWDTSVYARAAADYLAGANAYAGHSGHQLPFVYHPFVLIALGGLGAILPIPPAVLAFNLGTAIWAFVALRRIAPVRAKPVAMLEPLLVASTFVFYPISAFASGNLTVGLHFALMALAMSGYARSGRFASIGMLMAIVLFSVIKPYILLYAALVLLDRKDGIVRIGLRLLATIGSAAAIWGAGYLLMPERMADYIANVTSLAAVHDLGIGIYGRLSHLLPSPYALALHALVLGGLALWALRTCWRWQAASASPAAIFALAYMALTLLNPRLKDYDFGPALLLFAVAFWPISRWTRRGLIGVMLAMGLVALLFVGARIVPLLGISA